MLKFRKIIGVVLVLALFICSFASCQKKKENDGSAIDKANNALETAAYTVEATLEYSSDDEDMKTAIAAFSTPSMKIYVDGNKFQGKMDVEFDGEENYITYTYVDGVLYTEWSEYGKTVQKSEALGDADKSAITESYGAGANVGINDFEKVSESKNGDVTVINCETIKDDALIALVNSLKTEFGLVGFNCNVALKDAKLDIEIKDGKYDTTTLTCLYYISTSLDTYSVEMKYTCEFDYSAEFEITAPDFD